MKVKMNYSIDLGQVPFKVQEITDDVAKQLTTLAYAVKSLDTINTEMCLKTISKIREKIFFADNQLNDCAEILEGYQSTIENYSHLDKEETNFNVNHSSESEDHLHEEFAQDQLSDLQENLANIGELMKNE